MKTLVRMTLALGLIAALAVGCGSNVRQPGDDGGQPPVDTQGDTAGDAGVDVPPQPECETNGDCADRFPDAGPCQVPVCDTAGQCALENTKNYELCDDGDACTSTAVCVDGACQGIIDLVCDDGNACTNDTCDPATGCVFAPATGAACDDGDPCTENDACDADGVCEGGAYVCDPCTTDAECEPFEDGDLCNGTLACVDGTCRVDAATRVTCDTSADPACQATVCVPETGACQLQPLADDTACEDGNLCTQDDTCAAGVCEAGAYVCPACETATDCSDYAPENACLGTVECVDSECQVDPESVVTCDPTGDPCSIAYCDAADGACKTRDAVAGTPCDDGDPCTTADRCNDGTCSGRVRSCDDGDACTVDSCDGDTGECVNEAVVCDDGLACTTDACDEATGECAYTAVDCNDDDACTTDSCDEDTGECVNEAVVCDDGLACTTDTCDSATGECSFTALACDDQNPCTTDACDEDAGGCVYTGIECGDGDVCNGIETCDPENGGCVDGTPLQCPADDGDPCNGVEGCDPSSGCGLVEPAPVCDDGDPCNGEETCDSSDGTCVAGEDLVCDDGDPCNGVEACTTDVGCEIVTPAPECDDGIECTVDTCDSVTGDCVFDDSNCVDFEANCTDGVDNDTDGDTDCDDEDCVDVPACQPTTETDCDDDVDNDADGDTDCDDQDCFGDVACGGCPVDSYEDDDTFETATPVTAGEVIADLTVEDGDPDWFAVELCEGGTFDLQATFTHAAGDIDLLIYNADGQLVLQADSTDDDERVTGTILQGGTYVVAALMYTEGGCNTYDLTFGFDDSTCGAEICFDGVDNDGDEAVDCEDDDCADYPTCQGPVDCAPVTTLQCGQQAAGSTAGLIDNQSVYACDPLAPETGGEVVYALTPPSDGDVRIVLTPELTDVDLDAFVLGPECNTGQCLAAGATLGGEDFTFEATGGATYFLAIDGYDGAEGNFTVTVECFGVTTERTCDDDLDNDGDGDTDCDDEDCGEDPACVGPALCTPSVALGCGDSVTDVTTGGATDIDTYACSGFPSTGPEVAYTFTPAASGDVTLSLSGLDEGEDLDVFLLTGACDAVNCVEWGDEEVTFAALAGETYYVVVDGYLESAGGYTLDVVCEEETVERICDDGVDNDGDEATDCADEDCALDPACAPVEECGTVPDVTYGCGDVIEGSTIEGTSAIGAYDCAPWDESGPDAAFRFSVGDLGAQDVTLRLTAASGADLDLFVLAEACRADTCVAFGDTSATFTALTGATYYLAVDGYQGAADDFALTIECGVPTERDCADGFDNDVDGDTDCDDADCADAHACNVTGTCGAADTIACGQTVEADTTGEDQAIDAYACLTWDESGPELAYEFTATEDGPVTFLLGGLAADLDVVVLEGACEAAACVAQRDTVATIDAVAGQTYYVVVDGFQGAAGAFTLTAECTPPEPEICDDLLDNDLDGFVDCADLDCGGDPACEEACEEDRYEPNDTDAEATPLRAGEVQVHSICPVGDLDWFTFTLDEPADIVVQTDGADGDTQIRLYDGDLNQLAFDDDGGNSLFSLISAEDLAAGTYYVRVNEYEAFGDVPDAHGDDPIPSYAIRLAVQTLCAADDVLTCESGAVSGSTTGLTPALDGYGCAPWDLSGPEFVYEFTPDATSEVTLYLSDTTADVDILVMVDDCGTLNCGAAVDNEITFLAEGGTTYYVVVDGFEGAEGDYTLNVGCEDATERVCDDGIDDDLDDLVDCDDPDCAAAPACGEAPTCTPAGTIVCGGGVDGTTLGGESAIDAYACATFDESGPDAAYEFVAETTGMAVVDLDVIDDGGADLDLFVLEGACAADTCVASAGTTGGESLEFPVEAGVTYYIVVDGWQGAAADFALSLSCGEPRELVCDDQEDGDGDDLVDCDDPDCAAAPNCNVVACVEDATIGCDEAVSSTTVDATDEMIWYPSCSTWREDGPEVVYAFSTDTTQMVTFELSDLVVDHDLFVLLDPCSNTVCAQSGDRTVSFMAEAGETYYVVVDGYRGAEGTFTLTSTCGGGDLVERVCDDGVDNDGDQLTDCADPDCAEAPACAPQLCDVDTTLACGDVLPGTTFGRLADLTDYSCTSLGETGPEYVAELTVDFDRLVTLDLAILGGDDPPDLDLLVLEGACDASACVAVSATVSDESITWNAAADTTYYVVVDGYAGAAGDFELTATCADDVVELVCDDELDDDGDGDTDCDDTDCEGAENCAPSCVGDDYEPDDVGEGSTPLVPDVPQTHNICPVGDRDWYVFEVFEPSAVTIDTSGPGGDTFLTLYDIDGNPIGTDDDSGDGLFPRFTTNLDPGVYLVEFNELGDNAEVETYDILLTVGPLAPCEDDYEPDGTLGEATTLGFGEAQTHSICPVGDHDLYTFTLDAPTRVTIDTAGPSGDTFMDLLDEGGEVIESDDDDGDGLFPSITVDLGAGTYYVDFYDLGDNAEVDEYTILLTAAAECVDDAFEDNDTLETAAAITPDSYPAVMSDGEYDYYSFPLCAGAVLTATIEFEPDLDLDTDLYDAEGTRLTGASGFGGIETFDYTAEVAGTYYFRVEEYGTDTCLGYLLTIEVDESGCGPVVEICDNGEDDDGDDAVDCGDEDCAEDPVCITEICDNQIDDDGDGDMDCDDAECAGVPPCPCLPDLFEPNDETAAAAPILLNETLDVSICPAGDVDWFVFTLEAPTGVTFETGGPAGDTTLVLRDADGNEIASNDDIDLGGGNTFSRVAAALDAGTYYAEVHEFNDNDEIYDYTVSLYACEVDAYEDDDSAAAAGTLVPGELQPAHSICPAGDRDWYAFTLDVESDVTITTLGSPIQGPDGDTVMALYDADGNQIAFNDDPMEGIYYAAISVFDLPAGDYTVEVWGIESTVAVPAYDILLETTVLACPGDDGFEENDTLATSGPLAPGALVRAIRCAGDDDWYAVAAEPGCRVDATLTFAHADGDLDLRYLRPDNSLILASTSTTDDEAISAFAPPGGVSYLRVYSFYQTEEQGQNRYALRYTVTCPVPEVCDDGVDNDLDQATDCDDPDCAQHDACFEAVCDDGLDNDEDGDTDCDDADCAEAPVCLDDAFEDNDTFDTAVPGPDGGAPDLVSRDGDDDWFLYDVCAGGTITVDLLFVDAEGDIDLYLRGADDETLDSGVSTDDDETASWFNDTGGVAPVRVRVHNWTTDAITPYDMIVAFDCPEICDNQFDDDGDEAVDCADEDCVGDAACPPLPAIGWAAIQFPVTPIVIEIDDPLPLIFGRVYVAGLTEAPGKGFGIRGQLGYGPDGSDPTGAEWTWIEGVWNSQIENDDEFLATPEGVGVGLWDYAWRFTTDNGATWTIGDLPPGGSDDGYAADTTGSLEVQPSGPDGTCAAPFPLVCGDVVTMSNEGGDSLFDTYPGCGTWAETGPENVYLLTLDGDYDVTLTLSGRDQTDIDLFVLSDCAADACLAFTGGAETFALDAGTYHVVADGYEGAVGTYTLTVGCTPASETSCDDQVDNDLDQLTDCADPDCATDAACLPAFTCADPGVFTGDVVTGTNDGLDDSSVGSCTSGTGGVDAVWAWTPSAVGTYCLSTNGSSFDTVLYVQTTCDDAGSEVACDDDGGESTQSELSYHVAEADVTYHVYVDGWSGSSVGSYDLAISAGPCVVEAEICDDSFDNDADDLVDCDDPDCAGVGDCPASAPNPFFYIYLEGSSFNKALEIVNYTGAGPIDLSTCSVDIYFNGGTSPQSIALEGGTLNADEVFVICHGSFALGDPDTLCDQSTSALGFNGNDAIALVCGGTTYDVIGRIGENPGSAWGSAPWITEDQTLVRQYATEGDPDGSDAFDPDNGEWEIDGVDDPGGLGVWPYTT